MSVARWLETDTFADKDISSAVAIGVYTADADRMVVCDVSLGSVAGNGDYVIYLTRQINGAGSAYVLLPKTTCAAASGETAIAMQSGPVTVRSGDVVTVYIDGLAGDTTTPDTVVRWFEMATLRPATADRTLTVAATGEASANVTMQAGVLIPGPLALEATAQAILEDTGTTLPGLIAVGGGGAGAIAFTYTLTNSDGGAPIGDADVWVTSDEAGSNVLASGRTDQNGLVTFYLDAGTVYVWRQKSGWDFSNPDAEVVA